MDVINTWQFNLALYYVFVVTFFQFYKLSVKKVKKDGAATIILQVIAGLSQLLLIPLFAWQLPDTIFVFLLLTAACVFYAINDRLQTTVRKNLEVSVFSILSQFGTVFLIIYGFLIFKDEIVLTKILGALLIIVANIWVFHKPGKRKFVVNNYYFLGVVALLAFATAITIDIGISEKFNLPFYIGLTLLIPALMITVLEKIRFRSISDEWVRGDRKLFAITGLSWGLTILFGLRAFQLGEVSTIVPLQAIAVILNVLVAYIFLKERTHRLKKFLASIIAVIGVYLTVS